jgi:hypothetical protein
MQLVSLRRILNYRASCACCAQDWLYVIECDDHISRSITNLCLRCFHILQDATLVPYSANIPRT